MPDPSLQTDPTQLTPPPAPVVPRSVVGSMIAPRSTVPQSQPVAAQPTNVDQFMQLVRTHESGGNDQASSGVADGRYQFTPQTWAGVSAQYPELGLRPNDIWDGAKQDLAMRAITKDYQQVLTINGIQPTMSNMFMLHFLGTGGGPKFLRAMAENPNADASALFPKEAQYNPTIFHGKEGPRTLAQVYGLMTKTFGSAQVDPRTASQPAAETDPAMAFKPPQMENLSAKLEEAPDVALPDYVQKAFDAVNITPPTPLNDQPADVDLPDYVKKAFSAAGAAGAYTDKEGVYHPADAAAKDDKPAPEVMGVDPTTGTPIFADPEKQREVLKGEADTVKAFGAGLASNVTGLAEWDPTDPVGAPARLSQQLKEVGKESPSTFKVGEWTPALAPIGEFATGAKAALEAGEAVAPMLKNLITSGAKSGAVGGAAVGSTTATGEQDTGKRIEQKALETGESAVAGALGGGAIAGAGKAITGAGQWLGKEFSDIFSTKVTKAAEDLRTGFDTRTGKELTEEARAAKIATIERAAEKKVIAAQGERPVAPPEQVGKELQPVIDADRKEAIDRRRVESGFDAAVKSDGGQPSIPTKQFLEAVREAEPRAVSQPAKAALAALKEELKTKVTTPAVKSTPLREAIEKAYLSATKGAYNTRGMLSDIRGQIKGYGRQAVDEELRKMQSEGLVHLMSMDNRQELGRHPEYLKDAFNVGGEPRPILWIPKKLGQDEASGTVTKVSIQKARRIVQDLDSRIEGMKSDHSDEAHELADLKEKFVEHMEKQHPQLKTAREKYASESRNVDIYERKGKLAKASESDLYSKEPALDPTKIKALLTDKTEASGKAIERLMARDPEHVQDVLRQSFNHDLFGSGGGTRVPTVAQMTKFLVDKRIALEHSGLYKEFEKLRDDRAAFEGAADARKAALEAHHEFATIRTDLKKARKPEQIVAASKQALTALIRDRRISQVEYGRLGDEIKDVKEHIDDHEKARAFALKMAAIVTTATLGGGAYIAHRFSPR